MIEPVNNLEKSLIDAATNPAKRPQFYRDLLEAEIFLIQHGNSDANVQNNVLEAGTALRIQHIDRDGKAWLPIFTSLQRLQQFIRRETRYLKLKAKHFFEITRGAYIVLNPGFDYGKEFFPEEVERLLDGSIFQPLESYTVQKETEVLIGQPAAYPHRLVKALAQYFSTNPAVNRAYLAQIFNRETDEKPHLLIGIDANGDWEKVIGDAGMISSECLRKDEVIDFLRMDNSGVSQYMLKSTKPIYQKSFLKKLFG